MFTEIPKNADAITTYCQTRDIKLASVLAAHDEVKIFAASPIEKYQEGNGKPFYVFKFEQSDKAKEIIAHWCDVWVEAHPDDPLSYIYAAFFNRERYLDLVNKVPSRHIVRKGRRIYLVPESELNKEIPHAG